MECKASAGQTQERDDAGGGHLETWTGCIWDGFNLLSLYSGPNHYSEKAFSEINIPHLGLILNPEVSTSGAGGQSSPPRHQCHRPGSSRSGSHFF